VQEVRAPMLEVLKRLQGKVGGRGEGGWDFLLKEDACHFDKQVLFINLPALPPSFSSSLLPIHTLGFVIS
jgi:hypothetical protein